MQCLMCGEEMILIRIVEDTGKMVRGFERQSWQCSKCLDVEHRFVFTREKMVAEKPPVQPTGADQRERDLPSSMQNDVQEPGATPNNSEQVLAQIPLVPDDPPVQFSDSEPAETEHATSMQTGLEKHALSNPVQGSIQTLPSGPSSAPVDPLTETEGREPHVHAGAWIRAVTKLRSWQSLKGRA
jgi:hypothetical protein